MIGGATGCNRCQRVRLAPTPSQNSPSPGACQALSVNTNRTPKVMIHVRRHEAARETIVRHRDAGTAVSLMESSRRYRAELRVGVSGIARVPHGLRITRVGRARLSLSEVVDCPQYRALRRPLYSAGRIRGISRRRFASCARDRSGTWLLARQLQLHDWYPPSHVTSDAPKKTCLSDTELKATRSIFARALVYSVAR